jgi:PEGA domain-containing protein
MNLVLALEPDPSQAAPLASVVRRKLGANLTIVTTLQAAIIAMNHRLPDVLLLGKGLPYAERKEAAEHLKTLSGASGVRTFDIPKLTTAALEDQAAYAIRMCLAAAEHERVRAMATVLGSDRPHNEWETWSDAATPTPAPGEPSVPTVDPSQVQAEIDSRSKSETERVHREADARLATELGHLREDAASVHVPKRETPGPSPRRRTIAALPWRIVAAAALVLIVVVIGVMSLPHAVMTAARSSSSFVGTAQKAATAAAKQAVAAAPVVTRRALAAADKVIPHPDVKSVSTAAPAARSDATDGPTPITGPGFITAFARIPMDVYSDGKRIGSTEDGQLLLPSGVHQIEFVSERFKYRTNVSLNIAAGHVHPYTVTLPSADVHVTTTPGAEVWVDGERVGVAPLEQVRVPIGTREIVVRDSAGAEKRQVVEVKFGGTTEVSLTPEPATGDQPPATPHLAPLMRSR